MGGGTPFKVVSSRSVEKGHYSFSVLDHNIIGAIVKIWGILPLSVEVPLIFSSLKPICFFFDFLILINYGLVLIINSFNLKVRQLHLSCHTVANVAALYDVVGIAAWFCQAEVNPTSRCSFGAGWIWKSN